MGPVLTISWHLPRHQLVQLLIQFNKTIMDSDCINKKDCRFNIFGKKYCCLFPFNPQIKKHSPFQ
jgi:hypothetical protein